MYPSTATAGSLERATLVALCAESVCSRFKQHFYLYFLTVSNTGLQSKRTETDFKVNYLISLTYESIWILLNPETWQLRVWWWWWWFKDMLMNLALQQEELQEGPHQGIRSSGSDLSVQWWSWTWRNSIYFWEIYFWLLIGWPESSREGLVSFLFVCFW